MRKFLTLVLLSVLVGSTAWAQEKAAAYRAQGRYYSAKEAFENKRYSDAARMLGESRQMLGGKSNIRLQYLLVLSLYHAGRFTEAQVEMNNYLALEESHSPDKYANFPQDVDALTNDETRAITMLIDKIDAEVANGTEGKMAAERKAAMERQQAAKNAAALLAKKAEAFNALKACVLTDYVGKETPFPWSNTPYKVSVSLRGSFDGASIEILGTSDQLNDSKRWVPRHRHRTTCSVNLGQLRSFSFLTLEPTQSFGRARNGQRLPFSEGGVTNDLVLCGRASGSTLFVVLRFSVEFSRKTERKMQYDDGSPDGSESGDDTYSTRELVLPVHSEEAARRAVAAILALKSK